MMNSLDNPVFTDSNYVDDLWLTKDLNDGDHLQSPSMDVDIFCICNDDKIYPRKSSEAMNIPQVSSYYTKEAETWESSALLDTDVNFYDHSFTDRKCTGLSDLNEEESSPMFLWGNPIDMDSLKLEEIFQVEEAEAIQGPTLAQLNSKNEPMFEDMNFSDTYCEETKLSIIDNYICKSRTEPISDLVQNTSETKVPVVNTNEILQGTPHTKTNKVTICIPNFSPNCSLPSNIDNKITNTVQMNTAVSLPVSTHLMVNSSGFNKHHLLSEGNLSCKNETSGLTAGPISCSAPTESMNDLASKLQLTKEISTRRRNNSSTDRSVCSVSSLSLSNDESFDSSRDGFGLNEDASSNSDSGDAAEKYVFTSWFPRTESKQKSLENKKKKRYFWQYNIQSKGPKGPKIPLDQSRLIDPHRLSDARDPVFSTKCYLEGVKHSGKARRGDGNDLTPNPQKLYSIGLELKKLNKVINDLEPTIDQPFNIRPKSRREKNKLASRVCRLKKKAQHEANKLKLYGLQKEHSNLLSAIEEARQLFVEKLERNVDLTLTKDVEKLVTSNECIKVAGCTTEFVNSILEKVSEGDATGGLNELQI